VKKVIFDVLSNDERILKEPQATVGVLELAGSSVNFAVRPWVKTPDYWNVYFGVTESIKKAFDSQDITIPFPQRDVHLYQENT
jgi:small conductance mechanosensitive channel